MFLDLIAIPLEDAVLELDITDL
jgi:hypothetical protein